MNGLRQGSVGDGCTIQETGLVELYFYDELDAVEHGRIKAHVGQCRECAGALEDLATIRTALACRPDVTAPAGGDWSGFMRRLDGAVRAASDAGRTRHTEKVAPLRPRPVPARAYIGFLATAALLAIVTIGVLFVARQRQLEPVWRDTRSVASPGALSTPVATSGLRSAGARHFERSKLVVLGLADRESEEATPAAWAYERELATSLLNDTRLYRMAAEERGLTALAGVMRDLELVLLETSMAEDTDSEALGQIQRLIRKRGLVQKMDTVASAGM